MVAAAFNFCGMWNILVFNILVTIELAVTESKVPNFEMVLEKRFSY
jgi:hypothetical protein